MRYKRRNHYQRNVNTLSASYTLDILDVKILIREFKG